MDTRNINYKWSIKEPKLHSGLRPIFVEGIHDTDDGRKRYSTVKIPNWHCVYIVAFYNSIACKRESITQPGVGCIKPREKRSNNGRKRKRKKERKRTSEKQNKSEEQQESRCAVHAKTDGISYISPQSERKINKRERMG